MEMPKFSKGCNRLKPRTRVSRFYTGRVQLANVLVEFLGSTESTVATGGAWRWRSGEGGLDHFSVGVDEYAPLAVAKVLDRIPLGNFRALMLESNLLKPSEKPAKKS